MDPPLERHELAGVDKRERGFSRVVEMHRDGETCRASFRYEQVLLEASSPDDVQDALKNLVRELHDRGYRQLRSRLSFRGDEYRGSQEPWIEYLDPVTPSLVEAVFGYLRRMLRRERQ